MRATVYETSQMMSNIAAQAYDKVHTAELRTTGTQQELELQHQAAYRSYVPWRPCTPSQRGGAALRPSAAWERWSWPAPSQSRWLLSASTTTAYTGGINQCVSTFSRGRCNATRSSMRPRHACGWTSALAAVAGADQIHVPTTTTHTSHRGMRMALKKTWGLNRHFFSAW